MDQGRHVREVGNPDVVTFSDPEFMYNKNISIYEIQLC